MAAHSGRSPAGQADFSVQGALRAGAGWPQVANSKLAVRVGFGTRVPPENAQVIDFNKSQKRQNRSFRRFEVHGGYTGYEFVSTCAGTGPRFVGAVLRGFPLANNGLAVFLARAPRHSRRGRDYRLQIKLGTKVPNFNPASQTEARAGGGSLAGGGVRRRSCSLSPARWRGWGIAAGAITKRIRVARLRCPCGDQRRIAVFHIWMAVSCHVSTFHWTLFATFFIMFLGRRIYGC